MALSAATIANHAQRSSYYTGNNQWQEMDRLEHYLRAFFGNFLPYWIDNPEQASNRRSYQACIDNDETIEELESLATEALNLKSPLSHVAEEIHTLYAKTFDHSFTLTQNPNHLRAFTINTDLGQGHAISTGWGEVAFFKADKEPLSVNKGAQLLTPDGALKASLDESYPLLIGRLSPIATLYSESPPSTLYTTKRCHHLCFVREGTIVAIAKRTFAQSATWTISMTKAAPNLEHLSFAVLKHEQRFFFPDPNTKKGAYLQHIPS